jgi:hypothetical protein
MSATRIAIAVAVSALAVACGKPTPGAPQPAAVADPDAYADLEIGFDWASYTKVNREAFESPTHGKRFVDIWVNKVGLQAYVSETAFPVGTVIVKTSVEAAGGKPTGVAGPVFVMQKREAGYAPDHDDWWYALHWAEVPASWVAKMGAKQVYWRSPSSKVDYCWSCHEAYDRNVGMPPVEQRAFAAPAAAGG